MKLHIYLLLSMLSVMPRLHAQKKDMTMKTYSVEIIRYNIPAGKSAVFEDAYRKAGDHLRASPYCLGYEVIHGEDEPEHYIVRIHWTSVRDHLDKFRKSSEFMSFFTLVKPFFNNIEEMKHYNHTNIVWAKE
jgi:quinol monooxygenase YgiN